MTPESLAKKQRDILLKAEKKSASRIFVEFNRLKNGIGEFLQKNFDSSKQAAILDDLSARVDRMSINLAQTVETAQSQVIGDAARVLVAAPDLKTSIFETDEHATRKLIGRTNNGSTLRQAFQKIKQPLREVAAEELAKGFASGESAARIARRLHNTADLAMPQALTVSRTEQNEAYRAASRDFYKQAGIAEYVWMSVLNANTCVVCWHLHGRRFETGNKIFSHPNCRCVMVPVTKNMLPVETGAKRFKSLPEGFQKQILGAKKFELYKTGDYELSDFVGTRIGEKGALNHYPLAATDVKPGGKPQIEPRPEPKKLTESAQAARKMREVSDKLDERIKTITGEQKEIMAKFGAGGYSFEESAAKMRYFEQITQERIKIETTRDKQILDVLRVGKPTRVNPDFKSRFKAENKKRINAAIDDFNSLVDEKFLKDTRIVVAKGGAAREYYSAGAIHIGENTSARTVVHEIAHGLEQMGDGILKQSLEFYEHRTQGEPIIKLRKFGRGYRVNETCKTDDFWSPYAGKTPYEYRGKPFATEIISMGVERYYYEPLKFAESDPEFFDFIYTVVRGEKWSKSK